MLDKWLRKEDPSWAKMIVALEEMSETKLASRLRKEYLQQQRQDENPTSEKLINEQATNRVSELKLDRKDQVSKELEDLKERYYHLVSNAESALEAAKPTPQQLKRFSQIYTTDQVVTTIDELFNCLEKFCFLDYALLERIISVFLKESQSVVCDLSDYTQQLSKFKNSTTLNEFVESIERAHTSLTTKEGTGVCTVTLRLVGGWLEKTMKDLDRLLKEIFQDKASILAHLKIVRGSVIIKYFAPQSEAGSLIDLAKTKGLFMARVGVLNVQIIQPVHVHRVNINIEEATHFSFESSLIEAVVDNKVDLLTFLLDINTSPDATDSNGQTALMHGSYYGRDKVVSLLLKAKANPNLQSDSGITALLITAREGHSHVVSILLKAKANPDLHDDHGITPLHIAACNGNYDIVTILLRNNANPNIQREDGITALHEASHNRHSDIVSHLLAANANPNLCNKNGNTPLFLAAQEGHSDVVSILLKANANPYLQNNDHGSTPLHMAAQKGHSNTLSILLQANANPNLQRVDGATPLLVASLNGHSDVVGQLLKANADPNIQGNDGTSPLMLACLSNCPQIVQLLLTNGADPNLQNSDGINALICASYAGCLESTELLLKSGAESDHHMVQGLTATKIAVHLGNNKIADLLQAIELSQSSTTSSVLTPQEIANSTDNEAMAILNKEFENMIVAKVESYISNSYEKTKQTLPSEFILIKSRV